MNSSETKPNTPAANNSNSGGIFGAIGNAFKKATNAVVGNKSANSNAKKTNNSNVQKNKNKNNSNTRNNRNNRSNRNNSMNAVPAVVGVNAPVVNASPEPAVNNTAMKGGVAPVNFRYPPDMQQPSAKVMYWATTAGVPTPTGPEMRNVAHGGTRRNRNRRNKSRSGGSRRNRNRSRRNKTGGSRRNRNRTRRNRTRRNRN